MLPIHRPLLVAALLIAAPILIAAVDTQQVIVNQLYIPYVAHELNWIATAEPPAELEPTATQEPTPESTATATIEPTVTATEPPVGPTAIPTSTATATLEPTATQVPVVPIDTPTPRPTQPPSGPCPCDSDTMNCSNFRTQSAAQACMDWCVSQGRGDIHNLDGDANGKACESLPKGFVMVQP